ncbi:MAG: tetratricopeptide repeat protein [Bacteroidia bacterium]
MFSKSFFLFLLPAICISQNFDSICRVIKKTKNDTEQVNKFYRIGFESRFNNPNLSFQCAKEALNIANKSKSELHKAKAFNLLGILHYRKRDLKTALQYHHEALRIREQQKDEYSQALSETNLGNIYTDLNSFSLAENHYLNALQIQNKLGNDKQTGNCFVNLGVLMVMQKKHIEAEKYFYNAYEISKKLIDYEMEAMCLNNLSAINYESGNYEAAIGNALESIKIKEIMGNEMEKADSYINLSRAYSKLNDEVQYNYYINKADSLCLVFDYTDAKLSLLSSKLEHFETIEDYKNALLLLKKIIHFKDSLSKLNNIESSSLNDDEIINKKNHHQPFHFPYLMLFLLIVSCLVPVYILIKNMR